MKTQSQFFNRIVSNKSIFQGKGRGPQTFISNWKSLKKHIDGNLELLRFAHDISIDCGWKINQN